MIIIPVRSGYDNRGKFYQYEDSGRKYHIDAYGEDQSKRMAIIQAYAIEQSGFGFSEKILEEKCRRFYIQRNEDVHGLSGTGRVAEGVKFPDGTCVIKWNSNTSSIAIYNNIEELEYLHGHDGKTIVVWIDSILDVF